MLLTNLEIEKYSRQLIIRGWSADFQSYLSRISLHIPHTIYHSAIYLSKTGFGKINILGEDFFAKELLLASRINYLLNSEIDKNTEELIFKTDTCSVIYKNQILASFNDFYTNSKPERQQIGCLLASSLLIFLNKNYKSLSTTSWKFSVI